MNPSKPTRALALLVCALVSVTAQAQLVLPETRSPAQPRRVAAVPSKSEVSGAGSATATTPAAGDPAEPTVVLSPFEVNVDQDHGYLATSAHSGTRLRSDLKDIAAAVSVVTKDFMGDIAARNLEDLLTYTTNTEVDRKSVV